MAIDPQQFNKKCSAVVGRTFEFEGQNSILEKCKEACLKDERCYYFSWKTGNAWCIGCEDELYDDAEGAIAFKKKEQDEKGNKSVQLCLILLNICTK